MYILYTILLFIVIFIIYNILYNESFNIEIEKPGMIKYTYDNFYEDDISFFKKTSPIKTEIVSNISPDKNIKSQSYFYETEFIPLKSGNYSFRLQSKNASYLYIDDVLLIDNGGIHSLKEKTGHIYLFGGNIYKIKIYYGNNIGKSFLKFLWKRPSEYFYSEDLTSFFPPKLSR